jgi:hypothetical protein
MQQIPPIEPDEQIPVWDYTIALGPTGPVDTGGSEAGRQIPEPRELRLRFTYRERQDSWYVDVFEPVEATIAEGVSIDEDRPIMLGLRLTAGLFNSMFYYQIPELPGHQFFFALDVDGSAEDPGYDELGRSHAVMHTDQLGFSATAVEAASELGILADLNLEFGEEEPASIVIL